MKKFVFELQEVYDYRKFEQEQAEIELGKAIAVETQINDQLRTIAVQYANAKASMKGSLNFEDLMTFDRHTHLLDYQKEELLKQLSEAKIVTEQKRKVLSECIKKTSSLEKLKDVRKQEYKEELKRQSKKESGNLVNMKAGND